MDRLKKRLSLTFSNESTVSHPGNAVSKSRGRRGGLSAFHFKKATFSKELASALKTGDATKLHELLENGSSDIDDFEEVEKAVKTCCEKGYLDLLSVLIRFGASVNSLGENNLGPLHIAAKHGSLSIITLLLSNGANVNIQTKFERRTPLHLAALSGKEDSMKLLIEASNDIDFDCKDIYGTTPLHMAARMGHMKVVRLLLSFKRPCDVNMYDNEGWTALHLAAERGDTEIAAILVDYNAQVDCQNKYGRTPLHWAVIKSNPAMVNFLIKHRASATLKDLHGKCAMQYAKDPALKQILKLNSNFGQRTNPAPKPDSSIGNLMKIDPRESFIKRLGQPLPSVITPIAAIKKRTDNLDNLDTITEEMEAASSSRKSSIRSDEDAFTSDESFTKEKSPFVRSVFTRKNSNGSSVNSSHRNSLRSDFESSLKSNASSKQDPLTRVTVDSLEKVPSLKSIDQAWASQDMPDGDIPEEALLGKMQFRTMMNRIQRHQQAMENIVNSVSGEMAQAVTGRKTFSTEDILNVSNRLHKLQDMMFDFREENDRQAALMKNTLMSFLDTIKQRLSPRDPVPIWILHAFLHACATYLAKKENAWKQVIQRIPAVSEDKKSEMLSKGQQALSNDSSGLERANMVVQFAVKSLVETDCNKHNPLKALLVLITKCALEPNSAQIILQRFIHLARSNPEECLQHDNLFALSYRLGKDGECLGNHLGVSANTDTESTSSGSGGGGESILSQTYRQEENLRMLSKWRQASAKVSPLECVYDLVEGLVVIGREDLLVWILSTQKKRSLSSESSC